MTNFLLKRILQAFFLSFAAFLLAVPNYSLTARASGGELLISRPAPSGFFFILRFVHSVEQTPVEDEYRVSGGAIRQWEERVQSHNAGLPFRQSHRGRFTSDGEWMRFRGGGAFYGQIRYRVGNRSEGRNVLILDRDEIELFSLFPGKVLLMRAEKGSYIERALCLIFPCNRALSRAEARD